MFFFNHQDKTLISLVNYIDTPEFIVELHSTYSIFKKNTPSQNNKNKTKLHNHPQGLAQLQTDPLRF